MRRRNRYAIIASLVAVLALGGVAYASHTSNVSSLPTWKVTPKDLPADSDANVQLDVQTHTNFAHPGDKPQGGFAKTITLLFDNSIKLDLSGIPSCNAAFPSSTTLAQAWERCGPGADTAPEVNAYLSPPSGASGTGSTAPPSNFPACTLVFKRGSNPDRLLLFGRVTAVPNGTANCSNPGTNNTGNTSVTLTGTLSNAGVADFGKKLTVSNVDALPLPLDDFKAKVKRGGAFKARCNDGNELLNLRGTFAYTGSGQPNDTVNRSQGCEVKVGPPDTKITKARIKQRRRKAKFWFRAIGEATGFQCQLKRKGRRAPDFKSCTSPKVYKKLKRGKKYTFKVRAVGPGGKDESPDKKRFKIRKRR